MAERPDPERLLDGLNEAQRTAVTYGSGPLAIIARTAVALRRVIGMGPIKVERSGEDILALIAGSGRTGGPEARGGGPAGDALGPPGGGPDDGRVIYSASIRQGRLMTWVTPTFSCER